MVGIGGGLQGATQQRPIGEDDRGIGVNHIGFGAREVLWRGHLS